jgi:CHAT domain-containing protein
VARVATLWRVSDVVAADLADSVYAAIHPDQGRWCSPAHALHQALHACRDQYLTNPQLWAAHVHLGP